MPGTIQVTVLEFKGVSSPSKPSAKSLKVSMGKKQYQTWDKGNFSFPITKLGENLVVAFVDAGGNEIAHQDIRAMEIIEKGCWDEVFTINGGGHVHLNLQFFLTEEDRARIRIMRESAIKKKLETNPNIKLRISEVAFSSPETSTQHEEKVSDSEKGSVEVSLKVEASQAGSSMASTTSSAPSTDHPNNHLESSITNATDGTPLQERVPYEAIKTQAVSNVRSDKDNTDASNLQDIRPVEHNASKLRDIRPVEKSMNQDRMERSPSNVRKMISAFEITQLQEVKSMRKSSSVPCQLNKLKKGGLLEDDESKADKSSFRYLKAQSSSLRGRVCEDDSMRQSSSETATSSGRIPEESGSGSGSTNLREEESYSGMWIFPDNTKRLCITTAAGKQAVGNHHQHKLNNISSQSENVMHEIEFENEKNKKENAELAETESGSSPDNSSNGLVAQVIKIAVVIGFGVLVFLTRQKEPRKKKREENDNLFHVPEYVDTTLKPWTVKR